MKTLIAVLLLSISSLVMADFITVPSPYEQKPPVNYRYDHNHDESYYERYWQQRKYEYEQQIRNQPAQERERVPSIKNGRLVWQ